MWGAVVRDEAELDVADPARARDGEGVFFDSVFGHEGPQVEPLLRREAE